MTVEEEDPVEVGGAPESVDVDEDVELEELGPGGLEEVGPPGLEELEFPELEEPEPPDPDAPEMNDAMGGPGNV